MKHIKPILFGTYVLFFIGAIFIPLLSLNNELKSAFLLVFSNDFSIYSLLLLFPFLLSIASGVMMFFNEKHNSLIYLTLIFSIIASIMFFFAKDIYSGALGDTDVLSQELSSYIFGSISVVFALWVLSFVFDNNKFQINEIVEIAMLVALAVILDLPFLKIKVVEAGGSISFIMVPLAIIALRHGLVKGFIANGIIFGLTTCLIDGYGFFTFPFDYLLGFGSIAVVGLFKQFILQEGNKKLNWKGVLFLSLSFILGMIGRTLSSTISGIVFYGLDFLGSLVYQLTYLGPSMLICLVALILLYKPLLIVNSLFPTK